MRLRLRLLESASASYPEDFVIVVALQIAHDRDCLALGLSVCCVAVLMKGCCDPRREVGQLGKVSKKNSVRRAE